MRGCPRAARSLLLLVVVGGVGGVVSLAGSGCAEAPHPAPAVAPAPPPKPRLAVIPVESRRFSELAASLNTAVGELIDAKVWEVERPKVGLEDMQLSIECIEPSPACYGAVGQSLKVDRLVFGRMSKEGKRGMKVSLTLFDVTGKRVIASGERKFVTVGPKTQAEVGKALEALARDVMGPLSPPARPATALPASDRPSS